MMTRTVFILLISSLCTLSYCTPRTEPAQTEVLTPVDSISKDFRCDHGDFASPYRNRERAALR